MLKFVIYVLKDISQCTEKIDYNIECLLYTCWEPSPTPSPTPSPSPRPPTPPAPKKTSWLLILVYVISVMASIMFITLIMFAITSSFSDQYAALHNENVDPDGLQMVGTDPTPQLQTVDIQVRENRHDNALLRQAENEMVDAMTSESMPVSEVEKDFLRYQASKYVRGEQREILRNLKLIDDVDQPIDMTAGEMRNAERTVRLMKARYLLDLDEFKAKALKERKDQEVDLTVGATGCATGDAPGGATGGALLKAYSSPHIDLVTGINNLNLDAIATLAVEDFEEDKRQENVTPPPSAPALLISKIKGFMGKFFETE
jgi:hypothetical protein